VRGRGREIARIVTRANHAQFSSLPLLLGRKSTAREITGAARARETHPGYANPRKKVYSRRMASIIVIVVGGTARARRGLALATGEQRI
jgi:hypothetical protein